MMHRRGSGLPRRSGFTLLEILIVVAIIVVVAGIGGAYLFGALERGRIQAAKAQMKVIEEQVELYRAQNGQPPESLQVLLMADPSSGLPYLKDPKAIVDPWGKPYNYEYVDVLGPNIWTQPPTGPVISNHDGSQNNNQNLGP